jgi:hypothetical protein
MVVEIVDKDFTLELLDLHATLTLLWKKIRHSTPRFGLPDARPLGI